MLTILIVPKFNWESQQLYYNAYNDSDQHFIIFKIDGAKPLETLIAFWNNLPHNIHSLERHSHMAMQQNK